MSPSSALTRIILFYIRDPSNGHFQTGKSYYYDFYIVKINKIFQLLCWLSELVLLYFSLAPICLVLYLRTISRQRIIGKYNVYN